MLRSLAVALALSLGASAHAEEETLPPPPPPPPVDASVLNAPPAAAPGVSVSGQQDAKSKRYGKFAAGPGGPLLVFTELVTGLVGGGLAAGGSSGSGGTGVYLGALLGGVSLGTFAALYQNYVPIGMGTSALATLGVASGFFFGYGLLGETGSGQLAQALLGTLLSQVALGGVLLATYGLGDVSFDDASLIGMVAGYATALTFLMSWVVWASDNRSDFNPMLLAPAIGMGLGAALTTQLHVTATRILKLTALPLGVGFTLLYIGTLVTGASSNGAFSNALPPATALIGIVATFALTFLFTQPEGSAEAPKTAAMDAQTPRLALAPAVSSVGARNQSLAVGPGIVGRF